jgi:hypothetical protein
VLNRAQILISVKDTDTGDDKRKALLAYSLHEIKKKSFMFKAFGLFLVLIAEMAYAGHLLLQTEDPYTIHDISEIPILGDWYYQRRVSDARVRAEAGDVSAMIYLHDESRFLNHSDDTAAAIEMLRAAESPTARLFLLERDQRDAQDRRVPPDSVDRDVLLLRAKAMRENLRPPFPDTRAEEFLRQSRRNSDALALVLRNAQQGDETSEWIIQNMYSR